LDTTWSVRMPEEMKEKISVMITESGLIPKDFMTQLMQLYELNAIKQIQPFMAVDVEELSQLTGRIQHIFVNLCERVTTFQQQREEEFGEKLSEKDSMLSIFNERIQSLEGQLSQDEEEMGLLKKQYDEICQQYAQAEEICETHKALVLEYREKNDTLTGLLGEYKELKQMSEELKRSLDEEQRQCLAVRNQLLEKEKETDYLKGLLEDQKAAAQSELERRLELAGIAKEKEMLALQKDQQKKLEDIQQQYTEKVRELLEVIGELQKAKTSKKPYSHPVSTEE